MKNVRIPDNATIYVSGGEWSESMKRSYSGWGWFLAIVVFVLVSLGSTDGTETPNNNTPNPTPSISEAR